MLKNHSRPNLTNGQAKAAFKVTDRKFLILIFSVFLAGMFVSWLQTQILLKPSGISKADLNSLVNQITNNLENKSKLKGNDAMGKDDQSKLARTNGVLNDPFGVHVIVTSSGNSYQNIQMRILYQSFKNVQKMEGGEILTGFTRILHNGPEDDVLVNEVPTYRTYVKPNPTYVPGERCQAMMQWSQDALRDPKLIKGAWVHVCEPDTLWVRPLPLKLNALGPSDGYTQEFLYIKVDQPDIKKAIQEIIPKDVMFPEQMQAVGPFPTTIRLRDLSKLATKWYFYEQLVDQQTHKGSLKEKSGWIREMYTFTIAAHMVGLKFRTFPMFSESVMTQLPGDRFYSNTSSYFHYTWCLQIKEKKQAPKPLWQFEKRDWIGKDHLVFKPPHAVRPPPFKENWFDTWNMNMDESLYNATVAFIDKFNEVVDSLPVLERVGTT